MRTKGICSDCRISEAHYQNRLLPLQIYQLLQMSGNLCWNFSVVILIMDRKPRCFYGNIISLWTPHRPGAVFCGDFYYSRADIFFFIIIFCDFHTAYFYIFLSKSFRCFKCQICSYSMTSKHSSFLPYFHHPFCIIVLPSDRYFPFSSIPTYSNFRKYCK